MTKREKAIKGLKCCRFDNDDGIHWCAECPYQATEEEKHHLDWNCHIGEMVNDINDLLEAQASNEPVLVEVDVNAEPYWKASCKRCKKPLSLFAAPIIEVMNFYRYCPHCGRPLNWLPHIIRGMKNEL